VENIKVNFSIKNKTITAGEYINFCKKILNNLFLFDRIFSVVGTWDNENKIDYVFSNDLSDFNEKALKIIINEDKEIKYINFNIEDENLIIDSKSWCGFTSSFDFGNLITLNISYGSTERKDSFIKFEFNQNLSSKLDKHFIVNFMGIISSLVEVKFANCLTNKFFLKIRQKGKNSIGWINYSNNKNIVDFLSNNEVIKISTNGIFFSIADKNPFNIDDNNAVVERSKEISNKL
jgi:hypothetical protein